MSVTGAVVPAALRVAAGKTVIIKKVRNSSSKETVPTEEDNPIKSLLPSVVSFGYHV